MAFTPETYIEGIFSEGLMMSHFRLHGWRVDAHPAFIAENKSDSNRFKEDCDFIAYQPIIVMAKTCGHLGHLQFKDASDAVADYQSRKFKDSVFNHVIGQPGQRLLPIDEVFDDKFLPINLRDDQPLYDKEEWYTSRIWAVSDKAARVVFLFKGADVHKHSEQRSYLGANWDFLSLDYLHDVWTDTHIPYRKHPLPS